MNSYINNSSIYFENFNNNSYQAHNNNIQSTNYLTTNQLNNSSSYGFLGNSISNSNINNNIENQFNLNKKINNEIISKSIVYGSIAFWLGKKSEQNLTHKWCVYVRGINNEDISYFVKEVVFTLHATFENNVRTTTKWPFELYASGWGEFDIKITIHLIDESIKPIEFIHFLKLYPPANQTPSTKKPIVSEFFDEIVFVNPKGRLKECLLSGSNNPGLKKDTSIQIPLNYNKGEEEKKSVNSNQDENNNNIQQINGIENKLENMSIGNQGGIGIGNDIFNNNDIGFNMNFMQEELEMDNFDQIHGVNANSVQFNFNNDSISVFSNNLNVNNLFA